MTERRRKPLNVLFSTKYLTDCFGQFDQGVRCLPFRHILETLSGGQMGLSVFRIIMVRGYGGRIFRLNTVKFTVYPPYTDTRYNDKFVIMTI